MKMYGLFSYSYDYYEYYDQEPYLYCESEELEAVSESPDKLKDLVGFCQPIARNEDEHDEWGRSEGKSHSFIKEVTYIK